MDTPENLPPSVLRPKDANPMMPSVASVHLRHSNINPRHTTTGARPTSIDGRPKEPLPPGPQSVYMRTASDAQLLKNVKRNFTGPSSIASGDIVLSSVIDHDHEGQSHRASIASTASDDFYWPNDRIFEVCLLCFTGVVVCSCTFSLQIDFLSTPACMHF